MRHYNTVSRNLELAGHVCEKQVYECSNHVLGLIYFMWYCKILLTLSKAKEEGHREWRYCAEIIVDRRILRPKLHFPESPILPHKVRQHSSHKIPMPHRTSHGRLLHLPTNLAPPQYLSLPPSALFEIACRYLMLRLEMLSPSRAAQEVCFDWIAERECFWVFSAEHDHVGVVHRLWRSGWCRFAI